MSAPRTYKDVLPGGKSDSIPPSRFPPKKVTQGAKVESEHSSNPAIAKEIARDHLSEDMNYYEKLRKMEKKAHVCGFLDELTKISGLADKLVEKGMKAGDFAVKHPKTSLGILGATVSGLRASSRESWEQHNDNRAKLTDEEKKKMRRERLLKHHLPSVATGAAAGAAIPWGAKLLRKHYPEAMRSGMKNAVAPAAQGAVEGVAQGVRDAASDAVKRRGRNLKASLFSKAGLRNVATHFRS